MIPLSAPGAKEHHGIEEAGGARPGPHIAQVGVLWNQHPGSPSRSLHPC